MSQTKEAGQTLIEVIIALAVAVIVLSALVIATIVSIRNSQFSQNQSQATKLAQESLEGIRVIRDRDGSVDLVYGGGQCGNITSSGDRTSIFSDLWKVNMNSSCSSNAGNCYFNLDNQKLTSNSSSSPQTIDGIFKRQIIITDTTASCSIEKKIVVKVSWTDSSGNHESNLETILSKI